MMDIATLASSMPVVPAQSQSESGPLNVAQTATALPGAAIPSYAVASISANTGKTPSPDTISKSVEQVNDVLAKNGVSLYASYEKDKTTGIDVVQFRDNATHEVIRQIPSKAMLAIAQSIELPQGWRGQLLHDKS